jgi:ribosomal protein S18 acetylase RimI-like enzyme
MQMNTPLSTPVATTPAGRTAGSQLVTIRRAVPTDAPVLQGMLLELADHQEEGQFVHVDTQRWRDMLADPRVVVLLAESQPRVSPSAHPLQNPGERRAVGYVSAVRQINLWAGRDILALDDLYVRASARNQGVGDQLMRALARHAAEDQLTITWGMREDNHGAQRFYRRLGATLRTKVVAAWRPHDYAAHLDTQPPNRTTTR